MPKTKHIEESWFFKAARIIVRQGVPLRQAAAELEVDLTSAECDKVYKSDAFQEILQAERNKYTKDLANTPGRDKSAALGLLVYLIQKLIDEQQWDKAVVALEKLMKAEGWTGAESNINVFQGLTAKEYAQLLQEIDKPEPKEPRTSTGTPPTTKLN